MEPPVIRVQKCSRGKLDFSLVEFVHSFEEVHRIVEVASFPEILVYVMRCRNQTSSGYSVMYAFSGTSNKPSKIVIALTRSSRTCVNSGSEALTHCLLMPFNQSWQTDAHC